MSLIDFVKDAGEKLFGRGQAQAAMTEVKADPKNEAKVQAANAAAGDAILDYIKSQNLSATGLTVTFDGARTVGSLWVSGRFSKTYGSTGAASATLQYFLTPSVAVEGSGGNYLRDPFQGLPRAGFVAGGVRVFAKRRATMVRTAPVQPVLQPLIAAHRGGSDTIVVRFRMPAARSVAIAGNWNTWTPSALHALGDDIWEAALLLAPGTYYFNLVVDGREWVVPGGVATISDGMGGLIAVLNVL